MTGTLQPSRRASFLLGGAALAFALTSARAALPAPGLHPVFAAPSASLAPLGQPDMDVAPEEGLTIEAELGELTGGVQGSFRLTNLGTTPLSWAASTHARWLELSFPASTTLQPGATHLLDLSLDPIHAALLGAGVYHTRVHFRDATNGTTVDRPVELTLAEPGGGGRVEEGLVVEYRFEEAGGTLVRDVSGNEPALDLVIDNPSAVTWRAGALSLDTPTSLTTPGPATRLTESLRATAAMTVEAWILPNSLNQDGPARLVTLSNGSLLRNFTLGQGLWGAQPKDTFNMRLRSTATDLDGMPLVTTPAGSAQVGLQHVVYSRAADGTARVFVDGQPHVTGNVGGDLSNWDSSYRLALGNEIGASRPWLGEMHLVAIYDRALTGAEILQNFEAGSGSTNAGHLSVTPASSIQFTAPVGTAPTQTREYTLTNVGGEPLQWTAATQEPWLQLNSSQGSLAPGASSQLVVQVNAAQAETLPLGAYNSLVTFETGSNQFGGTDRTVDLFIHEPGGGISGEKPGPHNTGPTHTGNLTTMGPTTITQPGLVLENVRINGTLVIAADNVTVRNFIVDGQDNSYGIRMTNDKTGILLEDGEVRNVISSCLYGSGFTARRLEVHESGGDGFKAVGDTLVESCWIHHIGTNPNAHADGDQTRWGSNLTFRNNFFDLPVGIGAPYSSNAALIIQTGAGPIDNVLIEDNWLNGGNFTVYITDKGVGFGDPTNCRLINNRFGRDYEYGVLNATGYVYIAGNRWDDTGELMSINNN